MNKFKASAETLQDCMLLRCIKKKIKTLNDDLEPVEKRVKNMMLNNSIDVLLDNDNVKVAEIKKVISIRFDEKKWKKENEGWENGRYAKIVESHSLRID